MGEEVDAGRIAELMLSESVLIPKDVVVELYRGFEKFVSLAGGLLYNVSKKAGALRLGSL